MSPLLKRIAVHGSLTALMLTIVGFLFVQLAVMWMATPAAAPPGVKVEFGGESEEAVTDRMAWQIPLRMAIFGFVFVAIGEVLIDQWRKRKPAPPPPPPSPLDDEKLVQELLKLAEEKAAAERAEKAKAAEVAERAAAATVSDSPPKPEGERPPTA